jgi:hypothetical protein
MHGIGVIIYWETEAAAPMYSTVKGLISYDIFSAPRPLYFDLER